MTVTAQSVELAGTGTFGPSELLTSAFQDAGDGGDLTITTEQLIVRDGAAINAGNLYSFPELIRPGLGTPGNINIQASSILLDNQGSITTESAGGNRGNITLQSQNILLRRGSAITTNALGDATGGNITINADFIVAFPSENSDITANAFTGNGGRISITGNGIFGIEPRIQLTPLSDITASSEFGQQGEVEINTSAIDPTRGLNNLPQDTVEAEVAQSCQETGSRSTLEFFDVGRGGLPPTPEDLFRSEIVITEWIPLDLADKNIPVLTSEQNFTEDEIKNMTLLTTFLCQNN